MVRISLRPTRFGWSGSSRLDTLGDHPIVMRVSRTAHTSRIASPLRVPRLPIGVQEIPSMHIADKGRLRESAIIMHASLLNAPFASSSHSNTSQTRMEQDLRTSIIRLEELKETVEVGQQPENHGGQATADGEDGSAPLASKGDQLAKQITASILLMKKVGVAGGWGD